MSRSSVRSFSRRRAGLLALVLAAGSAMGVSTAPRSAHAVEVDAVTSVVVTAPGGRAEVGAPLWIDVDWAMPGAAAGDAFSLSLPTSPAIEGAPGSVDITAPDGESIGTCSVSTSTLSCALGEYADTHADVRGTVRIVAVPAHASSEGSATFMSADRPIPVEIPGGSIVVAEVPAITQPLVVGRIDYQDDAVVWTLAFPADWILDGFRIDDPSLVRSTYGPRLAPAVTAPEVSRVPAGAWDPVAGWGQTRIPLTEVTDYVWEQSRPDRLLVTYDQGPLRDYDADTLLVEFSTPLPEDARDGEAFTILSERFEEWLGTEGIIWDTSGEVTYYAPEASGDGTAVRTVSLTAQSTGPGAHDGPFAYAVACADSAADPLPGFPRPYDLRAGDTVVLGRFPEGTTCRVTETDLNGATSVRYSQNPVTVTGDSPEPVVVVAVNVFADVPTGGVRVVEETVGTAAHLVPVDTTYVVDYSYEDASGSTVSGELRVAAGGSATLPDVPVGTEVSLTGRDPIDVAGVTWADPVLAVDGVPAGSSARVAVLDPEPVEVALTNTASIPRAVVEAPGPGAAVGPGQLPRTGSDPVGALLVGVGLVVAGAVCAVVARRSRRGGDREAFDGL